MAQSSIQERLKMLIKSHGLTAASFADRVGVQRSSISHIMTGRNKPSLDFIQKTLEAFPKVNGDWLVTGRKNIQKTLQEEKETEEEAKKKPEKVTEVEDKKLEDAKVERKIEKVVLFYNDGTYEITYSKRTLSKGE